MRIKKIKFKDNRVELIFTQSDRYTEKEIFYKSVEPKHPDFDSAMVALVPSVYEILELPEGWKAGELSVNSVSFSMSEETGVEGAVLTGTVHLETSQSPFCFNTPHLPFEQYNEGGQAPTMDPETVELLERLRSEATDYMSGKKRAQGALPGTEGV